MSDLPAPADLISIVVPAYNAERFLERTLDTALRQTHLATEVILVNDGSTDRTLEIAETWARADERLRIISTPNRGVAEARNSGLASAKGLFVAFLDADDLWHPDKLSLQFSTLNGREADWAACYAMARPIGLDDEVLLAPQPLACEGYIFGRLLAGQFIGNGSSLLVRRAAALAVGGFDPSYRAAGLGGCEDLDFELKLALRWRMTVVKKYLVGYRTYEGSMSSSRVRMVQALQEVMERRLGDLRDPPRQLQTRAAASLLDYATLAYAKTRQPARALVTLCQLFTHSPARAAKMVVHLARRGAASGLGPRDHPSSRNGPTLPNFEALDPDQSFALNRTNRNHLAAMSLASLDMKMQSDITFRSEPQRGKGVSAPL